METKHRERHRWEEVADGDGIERCKFCGAFRRRVANVHTGAGITIKRVNTISKWIDRYSEKGKSKWSYDSPKCI